jgi:STE24 endopeptidase
MASWTNQFNISFLKAFVLGLGILVGFGIVVMLVSILSIVILKKQYTFTPLEDGELKDQINELQKDSKKKVKKIYIYDESKKSTRKNAFLLRFLWIREFGIADNFIKGNSQRELLAVLSHEIGHLKHKKTIWNYLIYAFFVVMFIGIVYLISHGQLVISISNWVNQSFNLKLNNYYLLFAFYMNLYKPFDAVVSVYASNVTRLEEYEADREAVKNGYGDELILTFKRLSSDELINVNPSPLIEFLEYDHPGMYRRIKAILNEKNKLSL